MLPREFWERVRDLEPNFSANGPSTALFLAGILHSDLPGVEPDHVLPYLLRLSRLVSPIEGCLVTWESTIGPANYRFVPHLGLVVNTRPLQVLHRPGYGRHIFPRDSLDVAGREYEHCDIVFYAPRSCA